LVAGLRNIGGEGARAPASRQSRNQRHHGPGVWEDDTTRERGQWGHRQGSRADFQSGGASFSLTLFEEVSALTIPGHVTIYRYEPEGLPEQRCPPVWVSGSTPRWPIPSRYVRSFTCS